MFWAKITDADEQAKSLPKSVTTPERSRIVKWITALGTLLVVTVEFLLLQMVYNWAQPTRDQARIAQGLNGAIVIAVADPSATGLRALRSEAVQTISSLASYGAGATDLRDLRRASVSLAAAPSVQAARELGDATMVLSSRLAIQLKRYDRIVDVVYAGLLLVASLGWMIWFRRLVARHRALQAAVTEQRSLAYSQQRLAALVRNSTDVVLVCDLDGRISFITSSADAVLGRVAEDLTDSECAELVHPEDRPAFLRTMVSVAPGADGVLRTRMHHADGRVLHIEGSVTNLIADAAVNGLVVTVRDVTRQVALQAELTHQAFHDALTGLANRQLFSDRLSHALLTRASAARSMFVLFCDLDEFKNVNDRLGHGIGDQLLAEVGRRAQRCIRPGDTAARLGGDEFAFLLEDADTNTALDVARRITEAIAQPLVIDGHRLTVQASIGLAAAVAGTQTSEEVLRNADVAMYLAKSRGSGGVAVYDERLHAEAIDRLEMRADLQQAIRDDELIVHYQPTVDLDTGSIAGFEALVRWAHPVRGLVSPVQFIPIAEQTGLIHALGLSVLRKACAAAAQLSERAGRKLTMSVNVTAQQLARTDFVDEVLGVLAETSLPPGQLVLEITESALLEGVELISERLRSLRSRGIRIAVDDFGTGYSSLSYLRDLPLDILKVDKAFVDKVATDSTDAALAEAILTMSRSMHLTTVAEGVEDAAQASWLRGVQCSLGQGYLWSKPMPLDEAAALAESGISTEESITSLGTLIPSTSADVAAVQLTGGPHGDSDPVGDASTTVAA